MIHVTSGRPKGSKMSTENEQLRLEIAHISRLIDKEKKRRQAAGCSGTTMDHGAGQWDSYQSCGTGGNGLHQTAVPQPRTRIYVNPSFIPGGKPLLQKSQTHPQAYGHSGASERVSVSANQPDSGTVRSGSSVQSASSARTGVPQSQQTPVPGSQPTPRPPPPPPRNVSLPRPGFSSSSPVAVVKPKSHGKSAAEGKAVRQASATTAASASSTPSPVKMQRLQEELAITEDAIKKLKDQLAKGSAASQQSASAAARRNAAAAAASSSRSSGSSTTTTTTTSSSSSNSVAKLKDLASSTRKVLPLSVRPSVSASGGGGGGMDTRKVLLSAASSAAQSKTASSSSSFSSSSYSTVAVSGGGRGGATCTETGAGKQGVETGKDMRKVVKPGATIFKPSKGNPPHTESISGYLKKTEVHLENLSLPQSKYKLERKPKTVTTVPSTCTPVTVPFSGASNSGTASHSESTYKNRGSAQNVKESLPGAEQRKEGKQEVQKHQAAVVSPMSYRAAAAFSSPPKAALPTRAQLKWTKSSPIPSPLTSSPVKKLSFQSANSLPVFTSPSSSRVESKLSALSGVLKPTSVDSKSEAKQLTPKSLQGVQVIASKYKFRKIRSDSGAATSVSKPQEQSLTKTVSSRYKLEKVKVAKSGSLSKMKPKTPVVVSRYKLRKACGLEKQALQGQFKPKSSQSPHVWRVQQQHYSQWRVLNHSGRRYGAAALWYHVPRHCRSLRQRCPHVHHLVSSSPSSSAFSWRASRLCQLYPQGSYGAWEQVSSASCWHSPWRQRQQVLRRVRNLHSSSSQKRSSRLKLDRRSSTPRTSRGSKGGYAVGDLSSRVVMINGFLYRSSHRKLARASSSQSSSASASSTSVMSTASSSGRLSTSVVIKKLKGPTMKTVTVRGVKFKMNNSGRTLQRVDATHSPTPSRPESPASTSGTRVKRVDIGGVTYIQTKPGTLERLSSLHSRLLASRVVKSSIARASAKFRKDNTQNPKRFCMFYNRFGKCNRGDNCPYIHDPDKVAVCTRFLRGTCQKKDCPFSHKVSREKMAVCSYFLRGVCSRDDCPYLHVKVNKNAEVCPDFLRGYCPLGSQCRKFHSRVCQPFIRTGTCPQGEKCKLKHIKKKPKKAPALPRSVDPPLPLASSTPVLDGAESGIPRTAASPLSLSSPSPAPSPAPQATEDVQKTPADSQSDSGSEAPVEGEAPKDADSGDAVTAQSAIRRGLKRLGSLRGGGVGRPPVTKMAKLPSFISLAEYSWDSPAPPDSTSPDTSPLEGKLNAPKTNADEVCKFREVVQPEGELILNPKAAL